LTNKQADEPQKKLNFFEKIDALFFKKSDKPAAKDREEKNETRTSRF
jgi:hypothetical protein